jgi:hypothetical protein
VPLDRSARPTGRAALGRVWRRAATVAFVLSLPVWLPCTLGATLAADAWLGWREEGEAVPAAFSGLCGLCLWGVVVGLVWALPAYALPALAMGWLRARRRPVPAAF